MAWIETIPEDAADGEVKELYERTADPATGRVDHIMTIHSLHPEGLRTHYELYREVMTGTPSLRKVEREMVALVVSIANHCHYWVEHHRRGLRRLLKDDELVAAIESDFATADISDERKAMLRYAEKLTRAPWAMTRRDVGQLTEAGFSDRDVLDIAEVVAYYAYANRIADGLGIETERWIDFSD